MVCHNNSSWANFFFSPLRLSERYASAWCVHACARGMTMRACVRPAAMDGERGVGGLRHAVNLAGVSSSWGFSLPVATCRNAQRSTPFVRENRQCVHAHPRVTSALLECLVRAYLSPFPCECTLLKAVISAERLWRSVAGESECEGKKKKRRVCLGSANRLRSAQLSSATPTPLPKSQLLPFPQGS